MKQKNLVACLSACFAPWWTDLSLPLTGEQLTDLLLLVDVIFLQKFLVKPVRMPHSGYWIFHLKMNRNKILKICTDTNNFYPLAIRQISKSSWSALILLIVLLLQCNFYCPPLQLQLTVHTLLVLLLYKHFLCLIIFLRKGLHKFPISFLIFLSESLSCLNLLRHCNTNQMQLLKCYWTHLLMCNDNRRHSDSTMDGQREK